MVTMVTPTYLPSLPATKKLIKNIVYTHLLKALENILELHSSSKSTIPFELFILNSDQNQAYLKF